MSNNFCASSTHFLQFCHCFTIILFTYLLRDMWRNRSGNIILACVCNDSHRPKAAYYINIYRVQYALYNTELSIIRTRNSSP